VGMMQRTLLQLLQLLRCCVTSTHWLTGGLLYPRMECVGCVNGRRIEAHTGVHLCAACCTCAAVDIYHASVAVGWTWSLALWG
jgi:hypothetical protein